MAKNGYRLRKHFGGVVPNILPSVCPGHLTLSHIPHFSLRHWNARTFASIAHYSQNLLPTAIMKAFRTHSRTIHGNKTDESIHPTAPVPKGYATVYVGMKERRRFLIPVLYLNHPALQRLLQKAEEEFGFQQKGGLTLPCSVCDFESRLQLVDKEEHERPCFFASLLHFKLHSSFVC